MATIDFSQFHVLAEQFRDEIPLKLICKQEGVSYRSYSSWRKRMGIAMRNSYSKVPTPEGMIEVASEGSPVGFSRSPRAGSVRIVFENGLTLEREQMDVDVLIDFLSKIRDVLCLG